MRAECAIVVLATHDLDLADGLLDSALFLRDGRMVDNGRSSDALRSTYRTSGVRTESRDIWGTAWLVLRKDLTVEVRSLEIAYTTRFFAIACVLFFAFALGGRGAPEDGAAGILWIAIALRGPLHLAELRARAAVGTLRALLMAPAALPQSTAASS